MAALAWLVCAASHSFVCFSSSFGFTLHSFTFSFGLCALSSSPLLLQSHSFNFLRFSVTHLRELFRLLLRQRRLVLEVLGFVVALHVSYLSSFVFMSHSFILSANAFDSSSSRAGESLAVLVQKGHP